MNGKAVLCGILAGVVVHSLSLVLGATVSIFGALFATAFTTALVSSSMATKKRMNS